MTNLVSFAVTAATLVPFNKTYEEEAVAKLDAAWEPLAELTPDMGAYLNEVSTSIIPFLGDVLL